MLRTKITVLHMTSFVHYSLTKFVSQHLSVLKHQFGRHQFNPVFSCYRWF